MTPSKLNDWIQNTCTKDSATPTKHKFKEVKEQLFNEKSYWNYFLRLLFVYSFQVVRELKQTTRQRQQERRTKQKV